MAVGLETAIQQFLDTARELQAAATLTAETVLQRVIQLYRNVRIDGAAIDSNGDMLLLQWGCTTPLVAEKPIDLRNASDDDIAFEESEQQYIDITRQVFAAGDDEDADFDDLAVHLSINLVYGPASGNEPLADQWIGNPDAIEREIKKFRSVPFVQRLLGVKASRLVATVCHCG